MRTNIQKIRENQLVAAAFLELDQELKIDFAESEVVDLFVELPIDASRFAVVTWPDRDLESPTFSDYLKHLEDAIDCLEGLPLIVARYDEDAGLLIETLVSWDLDDRNLNHHPKFKPLTKENVDRFFDFVRRQDSQVRILKDCRMVVKKFFLNTDRNGIHCNAQLVYLREFSSSYKMHPKPVENYAERFNRNLHGQPQNEYPHDFLDEAILKAIRQVYPDAGVVNSLLLTNTEYRSLLTYKNYQHDYAEFRFFPDMSEVPTEFFSRLGHIEGSRIQIDIFMQMRPDKKAFANEGFELRFPLDGWFETLNTLVNQMHTMHQVRDLV